MKTKARKDGAISKKIAFKEFLNQIDVTPSLGSPLLRRLPNKAFLPLIEKAMKKDLKPNVLTNLFYILSNSKNKISEKTLKNMFEEILDAESRKIGSLPALCGYLVGCKRKDYCDYLKNILEKYGNNRYLVENTYSLLADPIWAAGELGCVDCYEKIDEIAGYGNKINGRVLWSAHEALKKLEKEICSPKNFVLYIHSKNSLDGLKNALVKRLKARAVSYHAVELDGNRIEIWYDPKYDPKIRSRQSKYLLKSVRTDSSRTFVQQKMLASKLEIFFRKMKDTHLLSTLFQK